VIAADQNINDEVVTANEVVTAIKTKVHKLDIPTDHTLSTSNGAAAPCGQKRARTKLDPALIANNPNTCLEREHKESHPHPSRSRCHRTWRPLRPKRQIVPQFSAQYAGRQCLPSYVAEHVDDVKLHDNQREIHVMHLLIRGEELSDLSATSGAIFLASKLQEIVIRRHQEICDIAVDLGYGKGGWCPPPSRANDNGSDAVVALFDGKEFASSSL